MRKCIRCGCEMKEGGELTEWGGIRRIMINQEKGSFLKGLLGSPKVAICPNCGEVSLYVDPEKIYMDEQTQEK